MTHLTPAEVVDLVEGTLAPVRAAHADACAECRARAAILQSMSREAGEARLPEPSAVLLDRLSARVRAGVEAESSRRPWSPWSKIAGLAWPGAGLRALVPFGSAAALVLAVLAGIWMAPGAEPPGSRSAAGPPASVAAPAGAGLDEAGLDGANTEVWDVLTSVAADLQIDEANAAGMGVHAATIDGAVQRLSREELNELGRLLQSELKRPGGD
jgi:hypothetical protein